MKRILISTTCLLALAMALRAAGDWPEWRGPTRSGVVPEPPKLIDALPEKLEPAWSVSITKHKPETHSSPIVADGRAYVLSADEERYEENGKKRKRSHQILLCVSLADGKELWRNTYHGDASNTPCLVDGKLYFADAGRRGSLHCLDASTGAELWKCPLGRSASKGSPVAAGGMIVAITKRGLVAVDAAKGEKVWKLDVKSYNNSPVLWTHDGKEYLVFGNQELICVDPADGRQLWKIEGTKLKKDPASPVIHGDLMVTLFEGSGLNVYKLSLEGPEKIASAEGFVAQTGGAHQAMSPVFDGKRVYAVDKEKTFCWDLDKKEIVWKAKKGDTHASPVLVGEKLLVNHKRSLIMLDAKTGEKLGEAKNVDAIGCSSCAFSDGKLVVHEARKLNCYDLTK